MFSQMFVNRGGGGGLDCGPRSFQGGYPLVLSLVLPRGGGYPPWLGAPHPDRRASAYATRRGRTPLAVTHEDFLVQVQRFSGSSGNIVWVGITNRISSRSILLHWNCLFLAFGSLLISCCKQVDVKH